MQADLDDLNATPLPDWSIDITRADLPAMLARGIYDAEPEDRSKREWAQLLGISKVKCAQNIDTAPVLKRKAAYHREARSEFSTRAPRIEARELGAKIVAVEVDGGS